MTYVVAGVVLVSLSVLLRARGTYAIASLMGGVLLIIIGPLHDRLLRGKLSLTGLEVELAETRGITTGIAEASEPVREVGPEQEDDVTRWFLAQLIFENTLLAPPAPVEDCRFQVYLFDADAKLLLPVLEPGHGGSSPGFSPGQGATGHAWATGEYVVAEGTAVWDDTFGLSSSQQKRYADLTAVSAMPVTNSKGQVIAVLAGSSRDPKTALTTPEGFDAQMFLAEVTSAVLVDLLKWSDDS